MIRDYAKRNTSKNRNKKKSSHLVLWIIVIFLFTIFTLSLVFFGKYKLKSSIKNEIAQVSAWSEASDKKLDEKLEKNKEKTKIKQKNKDNKDLNKTTEETKIADEEMPPPKFDFYTILPEKNDNKSMIAYEIEIAVTKDQISAENLKMQLSLLGLVAQITTVQKTSSQPKYRVSIGPYDNKPAAIIDLEKIQQDKIHGKIKKIY